MLANWLWNFGFCWVGDFGELTVWNYIYFFLGVTYIYFFYLWLIYSGAFIVILGALASRFLWLVSFYWTLTSFNWIVSVFPGFSIVTVWCKTILLILSSGLTSSLTCLLSNNLFDSSINASNLSELGTVIICLWPVFYVFFSVFALIVPTSVLVIFVSVSVKNGLT